MKKLLVALIVVAAGWYLWNHRQTLLGRIEQQKAVATAETSAEKAKARVNEGKAVDAAVGEQAVTEGMKPEEVRSLMGEPTGIDRDPAGDREVWRYELVGRKVTFRRGRVYSVESEGERSD